MYNVENALFKSLMSISNNMVVFEKDEKNNVLKDGCYCELKNGITMNIICNEDCLSKNLWDVTINTKGLAVKETIVSTGLLFKEMIREEDEDIIITGVSFKTIVMIGSEISKINTKVA